MADSNEAIFCQICEKDVKTSTIREHLEVGHLDFFLLKAKLNDQSLVQAFDETCQLYIKGDVLPLDLIEYYKENDQVDICVDQFLYRNTKQGMYVSHDSYQHHDHDHDDHMSHDNDNEEDNEIKSCTKKNSKSSTSSGTVTCVICLSSVNKRNFSRHLGAVLHHPYIEVCAYYFWQSFNDAFNTICEYHIQNNKSFPHQILQEFDQIRTNNNNNSTNAHPTISHDIIHRNKVSPELNSPVECFLCKDQVFINDLSDHYKNDPKHRNVIDKKVANSDNNTTNEQVIKEIMQLHLDGEENIPQDLTMIWLDSLQNNNNNSNKTSNNKDNNNKRPQRNKAKKFSDDEYETFSSPEKKKKTKKPEVIACPICSTCTLRKHIKRHLHLHVDCFNIQAEMYKQTFNEAVDTTNILLMSNKPIPPRMAELYKKYQ